VEVGRDGGIRKDPLGNKRRGVTTTLEQGHYFSSRKVGRRLNIKVGIVGASHRGERKNREEVEKT